MTIIFKVIVKVGQGHDIRVSGRGAVWDDVCEFEREILVGAVFLLNEPEPVRDAVCTNLISSSKAQSSGVGQRQRESDRSG